MTEIYVTLNMRVCNCLFVLFFPFSAMEDVCTVNTVLLCCKKKVFKEMYDKFLEQIVGYKVPMHCMQCYLELYWQKYY